MNFYKGILTAMAATIACIGAQRSEAAELATHLFTQMDGDVHGGKFRNTDERLEIGYEGRKSVGWIVFQTGGADLSLASGASVTLHVDQVHYKGTLKVFALTAPINKQEDQVGPSQLSYNPNLPVASLAIGNEAEGKIIRLNLGTLLANGPFYGVVIGSTDGLRADFSSKDSDLPPMIELRYAFATLAQVNQAIELGSQTQGSATAVAASAAASASAASAANSAASAQAAVDAVAGHAGASEASAALAGAASGAAGLSATTSAASAIAAAASAAQAAASAAAATGSAGEASASAAAASAASTTASAASGTASAASATASVAATQAGAAANSAAGHVTLAQAAAAEAATSVGQVQTQAASAAQSATAAAASSSSANAAAASAATSASTATSVAATLDNQAALVQGLAAGADAAKNGAEAAKNAAEAAAASMANGAAFPSGTTLLNVNPTPPPGFAATGIRVNFEGPWLPKQVPSIARSEMASAVMGGKLYAAGGTTGLGAISIMQVFDPALGTWTGVAGLPSGLRQHSMVESGGSLYVTGGIDNGNNVQGACLRYDQAANAWTALAPMPARWGHASVAAAGKIYVFGGYSTAAFAHMTPTYVYDIASNTWSVGSTLPTWRAQMQAREAGGRIFVMGGTIQNSPLQPVAVNEVYDIASDSWSAAAPMPAGRLAFCALVDHDRIFVMGGEMGGPTNTNVQYDAKTDSWVSLNPMIQARRFFALGLINGKAYASLGFGTANLSTTEEYLMPKTVYLVEKI